MGVDRRRGTYVLELRLGRRLVLRGASARRRRLCTLERLSVLFCGVPEERDWNDPSPAGWSLTLPLPIFAEVVGFVVC